MAPNKETVKATLFVGDITNHCKIDNLKNILSPLQNHTFVIKDYDFERNKVEISLKKYLADNLNQKRGGLDYDTTYEGIIIGQKNGYYYLIIKGLLIEGKMQMTTIYQPGTRVSVNLASNNLDLPEFYV